MASVITHGLWNKRELFLLKVISDLFLSLTLTQEASGGTDDQMTRVRSNLEISKDDTVSCILYTCDVMLLHPIIILLFEDMTVLRSPHTVECC